MTGGSNFASLDCAPVDQPLEDSTGRASALFPKFVMRLSTLLRELRKQGALAAFDSSAAFRFEVPRWVAASAV